MRRVRARSLEWRLREPRRERTMAEHALAVAENTPGRYYVDRTCIDCELCHEIAPGHFARQDEGGYSFVHSQPRDADQEAHCHAALEECPVEAIGCHPSASAGAAGD